MHLCDLLKFILACIPGQLEGISFTSWIEQTLDGRELAPFMLFPSCAAPLVMFYDDHLPKSPPAPFAPNPSLHPILADSLSHLTTLVSSRKGTYYRNPLRVSPSKKMPVALGAKSSESVGDGWFQGHFLSSARPILKSVAYCFLFLFACSSGRAPLDGPI